MASARTRVRGGNAAVQVEEPNHEQAETAPTAVLYLRPKKQVQWDKDVHDTEGKKSSKSTLR